MIKAIVFDLDHTLFDRYATIRESFTAFYEYYRDRISQDLSYEDFVEKIIEMSKNKKRVILLLFFHIRIIT